MPQLDHSRSLPLVSCSHFCTRGNQSDLPQVAHRALRGRDPSPQAPQGLCTDRFPQQECSCSSRTRLASPWSPGRVVTRAQAPGRVACVNSSATTGSLWVAAGYLLSCASVPTPLPPEVCVLLNACCSDQRAHSVSLDNCGHAPAPLCHQRSS